MRRAVFCVLLLVVLAPACGEPPRTPTPAPVHLRLAGPADFEPLGQALAAAYAALRPHVTVTYLPGDWESGPATVRRRSAEVGLWTGLPTDGVMDVGPDLTTTLIARDAIAVVVAPHNPVVSLSLPELQTMFAGRTPNWQTVGGNDQEVQTICWYDGARLRVLFDGLVLRDRRLTPTALVAASNEGVQSLIAAYPNAIGYVHWRATSAQARVLAISGVLPTAANVSAGQYPLSIPVVLATRPSPDPDVRDFVRFVRSPDGQAIVGRWLAPAP